MIDYFFWGIVILFGATAVYYIIFLSLVFYWHEKKTTFIVVPVLYTFEFFLISFLVISAIAIALRYLPALLNLL
ncbi:MAG: hypothetical protein AAB877_02900 [Patescibacteria group bacterium]